MKKKPFLIQVLLIFTFLLLFQNSNAQIVTGVTLYPTNAQVNQNTYIIASISTAASPIQIKGYTMSYVGFNIKITACYHVGIISNPAFRSDTFLIGNFFLPGSYHAHFVAKFKPDTLCQTYVDIDSMDYYFPMPSPNAIYEQLQNQIVISPTLATNKIFISTPQNISSITITNIIGEKLFFTQENKNEIDISFLQQAIYFISIQTKQGTITKKFIKQ